MPYIGHQEPDLTDLGFSPRDTPGAGARGALAVRATRLVERAARGEQDRALLLEVLGLAPERVGGDRTADGDDVHALPWRAAG